MVGQRWKCLNSDFVANESELDSVKFTVPVTTVTECPISWVIFGRHRPGHSYTPFTWTVGHMRCGMYMDL